MTCIKRHTSAVLAGLALICSLASAAHAGPFHVKIESTETLIPQPTNKLCPARGMLSATGSSEQLGSVQVFATDCVTMLNQGSTLRFNQGRMILIAEDGSGSVIASYQGFLDLATYPPEQTNRYVMRGGTFTIIGGTGRYMKATGSGILNGIEYVNSNPAVPAQGVLEASGTIIY